MGRELLADAIVVLHLAYVLFVLLGFAAIWIGAWLHWSWTRRRAFRVTHLACTLVVALEAVFGVVCPLTEWEYELRLEAGQRLVRRLAGSIVHKQHGDAQAPSGQDAIELVQHEGRGDPVVVDRNQHGYQVGAHTRSSRSARTFRLTIL